MMYCAACTTRCTGLRPQERRKRLLSTRTCALGTTVRTLRRGEQALLCQSPSELPQWLRRWLGMNTLLSILKITGRSAESEQREHGERAW